jgi:hypothetical protein
MITAVIILAAALAVAAYLTYSFHRNEDQPTELPYTKEELENIKLAEELYNKDLRPVVARKAKPKVAKELEVIEPEFVAKESKPEFPIDRPKKKRKYYPKKK